MHALLSCAHLRGRPGSYWACRIGHVKGRACARAATTLTATYNDLEGVRKVFEANKGEIAGVILEPVVGNSGFIAPTQEFLQARAALCLLVNSLSALRRSPTSQSSALCPCSFLNYGACLEASGIVMSVQEKKSTKLTLCTSSRVAAWTQADSASGRG